MEALKRALLFIPDELKVNVDLLSGKGWDPASGTTKTFVVATLLTLGGIGVGTPNLGLLIEKWLALP